MEFHSGPLERKLQSDLERLQLEPHLAELLAQGYTVVPPDLAAPPGFIDRLLEASLDVVEQRSGTRPDLETGSTHVGFDGGYHPFDGVDSHLGEAIPMMIGKGRVFEELALQPSALTLATALLGYQCVLAVSELLIKGPNQTPMSLHTDTAMPAPLPQYAMTCNCFWMLQDSDREGGATAIIPGSHQRFRNPSAPAGDLVDPTQNPDVIPIEAEAGSLVVWHGHTWHGAFPRKKPGLRIAISYLYSRPALQTPNRIELPAEVLERNPLRFSILAQEGLMTGGTDEESYQKQLADAFNLIGRYLAELGVKDYPDLNSTLT